LRSGIFTFTGPETPRTFTNSNRKTQVAEQNGAISGAVDADLRLIIEKWDKLPEGIKADILRLVEENKP
jgi:hypothetical protein